MKHMIVTGSGGLIGGEVAEHFLKLGWKVTGIDNNFRQVYFGEQGSTNWRIDQLKKFKEYKHRIENITWREGVFNIFRDAENIDAVVHCAAQPSHDLPAKSDAFALMDFDTNVIGTFNLLMAAKKYCLTSPFVFMSTNKVYGDNPNKLNFYSVKDRWMPLDEYAKEISTYGFNEKLSIDDCKHSLFGAGKASADLYVQEFGRYFNMPTTCLRGGCLTGPNHSGVELHGFLNYLIKCNLEGKKYTVFGYEGRQVRDNIHSFDVACFIEEFIKDPTIAQVYNIGGGMGNSISILESFMKIEQLTGLRMKFEITDQTRQGDHQWYVSDLRKMMSHYPNWKITKSLDDIFSETVASWQQRFHMR